MTPHINAPEGAFAKTVLMPGDPLRAKFIAETFLESPKLVNNVRNMLAFTGTYKGKPVSVMASGMGMPSIGIYSHELYKFYGVENIIRIGSAGSYNANLNLHDVVLANSAYSLSSYAMVHDHNASKELFPSANINETIMRKAQELNIKCTAVKVYSSDVFYGGPSAITWQEMRETTGVDCVEMESFGLFHNADILGKKAVCLCTVSDSFVWDEVLTYEMRRNSFNEMIKLALEAAVTL